MNLLRALALLSSCSLGLALPPPSQLGFGQSSSSELTADYAPAPVKVSVKLGVMSKCPDAELCETVWDRVLDRVGDLVELQLIYIAQLNESEPLFGVTCMHGASECVGNVQQLCAAAHWNEDARSAPTPWKNWWHFVQCMNYGGKNAIGTVALAESCARTASHTWGPKLRACAEGDEGRQLLRDSATASKLLGVTHSCTILLEENPVCVHDGTWKQCEGGHEVGDFVEQVKAAYNKLNQH